MVEHNDDGNTKQSTHYGWASASVTADGTAAATDLTSESAFETILSDFGARKPRRVKVEASAAAYVKFNGGDVITIGATSPIELDDLIIESIGVSTGGSPVTITVTLQ